MFSFKRQPTSPRPQLLPPRPSYAQRSGGTSGSRSGSGSAAGSRSGSPLASPQVRTPGSPFSWSAGVGAGGDYFSLPPHANGSTLAPEAQREYTDTELDSLRQTVQADLGRMEEIVSALKRKEEVLLLLGGAERELELGLKRFLKGVEGVGVVASPLPAQIRTSHSHSLLAQSHSKSLSRQSQTMLQLVTKHRRFVTKTWDRLDTGLDAWERGLGEVERPLHSLAHKSPDGARGVGEKHEKYLRAISGLIEDTFLLKQQTAQQITQTHTQTLLRFSAHLCAIHGQNLDAAAEGMRVAALGAGEVRFAGVLAGVGWVGEVAGLGWDERREGVELELKSSPPHGNGERARPGGKRQMPLPPVHPGLPLPPVSSTSHSSRAQTGGSYPPQPS